MFSATALPATPPTTAPTGPPTAAPTAAPAQVPAAPPPAAPTPVPTGCEPGAPVIGSGLLSRPLMLSLRSLGLFFSFMIQSLRVSEVLDSRAHDGHSPWEIG